MPSDFTGTPSKLGGLGLEELAEEIRLRHLKAYPADGIPLPHRELEVGGEYQWRREGEPHLFDPETVFRLQHATRARRYDVFRQYTQRVDEQSERLMTLRGLLELRHDREPVPIDEVEPVAALPAIAPHIRLGHRVLAVTRRGYDKVMMTGVVQGGSTVSAQYWAKWEIPGNEATYVIVIAGPEDQAHFSFDKVVVITDRVILDLPEPWKLTRLVGQEPHRSFGVDLVGQDYELDLRTGRVTTPASSSTRRCL